MAGSAGLQILCCLLTKTKRMIVEVAEGEAAPEAVDELIRMARASPAVREKVVKAEQHYRTRDNHIAADRLQRVLLRSCSDTPSTQQNPSQTRSLSNPRSLSSIRTYSEGARRIQERDPTADQGRRGQHPDQVLPPLSTAFDIESQQQPLGSERDIRNRGDHFPDGPQRLPPGLRHGSDVSLSPLQELPSSRAQHRSWFSPRKTPGQIRRQDGSRQATSGQGENQLESDQATPGGAQQQSSTRRIMRDRSPQPLGSGQTTQGSGSRQPTPGRARRQTGQTQP